MKYSGSRRLTGAKEAALAAIEAALLPNGFKVLKAGPSGLEFGGPGLRSTKENPLRGASEIQAEVRGGRLHLDAALCGLRFLVIFVCAFPPLLIGGLALLPVIKAGGDFGAFNPQSLFLLAPWVLISPLMVVLIRKRTIGALDDLLDSAVVLAERGRK